MVKMAWDLLLTSFIFVLAVALNNRRQMKISYGCSQFLPASYVLCARPAGPKITSHFPCLYLSLCIHIYHVCNNYITYIVVMRPYLS